MPTDSAKPGYKSMLKFPDNPLSNQGIWMTSIFILMFFAATGTLGWYITTIVPATKGEWPFWIILNTILLFFFAAFFMYLSLSMLIKTVQVIIWDGMMDTVSIAERAQEDLMSEMDSMLAEDLVAGQYITDQQLEDLHRIYERDKVAKHGNIAKYPITMEQAFNPIDAEAIARLVKDAREKLDAEDAIKALKTHGEDF